MGYRKQVTQQRELHEEVPGCYLYTEVRVSGIFQEKKKKLIFLNIRKILLNGVPQSCHSIWKTILIGVLKTKQMKTKQNKAVINSRKNDIVLQERSCNLVYCSEICTISIAIVFKN